MNVSARLTLLCLAMSLVVFADNSVKAQTTATERGESKEASESVPEVHYIDGGQFLPKSLRKIVPETKTVTLANLPKVISEEFGIPTVIDSSVMEAGIDSTTVSVVLYGRTPLYVSLDRFADEIGWQPPVSHKRNFLAWEFIDGVLVISDQTVAEGHFVTRCYDVSALTQAGWTSADVEAALHMLFVPWFSQDGVGGAFELTKNVLVVKNDFKSHRLVSGLLAALNSPAMRVHATESHLNAEVERRLRHIIDFNLGTTSLVELIEYLAKTTNIDCRFHGCVADAGIVPETEMIRAHLKGLPIRSALQFSLDTIPGSLLSFIAMNGQLVIVDSTFAEDKYETVIYAVSDILRAMNGHELKTLMQNQTRGPWFETDGSFGDLRILPGGKLIVRQNSGVVRQVQDLIEELRSTLIIPEPVIRDPGAVEYRFYRVDQETANSVAETVRELIAPDTWQTEQYPDSPGDLRTLLVKKFSSQPRLTGKGGGGLANAHAKERVHVPTEEIQHILLIR